MAYEKIRHCSGGWPGFELVGVRREGATPQQPVPRIVLTLKAVAGQPRHCSRCGEIVGEVHDVTTREVRDLPILDAETWLVIPRVHLKCPRCGPTVEAVPWLDRYQRRTHRLAASIVPAVCDAADQTRGGVVWSRLGRSETD
jgi:transposase